MTKTKTKKPIMCLKTVLRQDTVSRLNITGCMTAWLDQTLAESPARSAAKEWASHTTKGAGLRSSFWGRLRRSVLLDCSLSLVPRGFVAVYSTFAQFNLRLKFCLYVIVHVSLEEFRFSLKSSLSTQSVCHTLSGTRHYGHVNRCFYLLTYLSHGIV